MLWQLYRERFFPINISTQRDALVIDDRRPSDDLLLFVTLLVGSLFISAILLRPLIANGIYWPLALFLLPAPIFAVKCLRRSFREKYVFDKSQETYTFKRRSVLKSPTTQGDLSLIRAVQIERTRVTTEDRTKEVFRVVLLLRQGLLLGASDSLPLREGLPLGSTYESEAQIANAIANFLDLGVPETVDVLQFQRN
ncbi:MAG: hypothetical protein H0U54_17180 [Acidobacteria bacterium]|nr:hypothetical protein [Acidobacteriota bacterium]